MARGVQILWRYLREFAMLVLGGFVGAVFSLVGTGNLQGIQAFGLIWIYGFVALGIIFILDLSFKYKRSR